MFTAVTAAAALVPGAPARSDAPAAAWPGKTVIVGYSSDAALARAVKGRNAKIVAHVPQLDAVEVRPAGDPAAFAAAISRVPGIDYVQPPAARRPFVEPALAPATVPGGAYQWQYTLTGADRVPERAARGALGIRIAVIDSGADLNAPDLAAKSPLTYNAIDGTRDVTDTVGHGTFVASLAAGSSTNGEGIAGMAGEARLVAIKASAEGMFSDFELAAAITFAVDNGAKVVNLSLGGTRYSATELRALEYAIAKDVLLVAAAGNEYQEGNPVEYPAALLQPVGSNGEGGFGLSVAASTMAGTRAPFSNTGSYISLAAPGHQVFAAVSRHSSPKHFPRVKLPGSSSGFYGYGSGTSYSAPQVAGAAALVWGANSTLSARQVMEILKATASGKGQWNPELGYGVIDVAAAVDLATRTPGVTLSVFKWGNTANLLWRGTRDARSYRLLVTVGKETRVVLDRATTIFYKFEGGGGRTHAFTVEALDGAGNVIATSATMYATLGQAASKLLLKPYKFTYRKKRYSLLLAFLQSNAPDVRLGQRMIELQHFTNGRWQYAGLQFTDGAGRAIWQVPPGTHRVRARFSASNDLGAAATRPLTVRGS